MCLFVIQFLGEVRLFRKNKQSPLSTQHIMSTVTVTAPVPIRQFLGPPRTDDGNIPPIIVMGRRETGKTAFAVRMVEEFVKRNAEIKEDAHVQVCVPEKPYGNASERFADAGCAPIKLSAMYAANCESNRAKYRELRAAISECREKSREGKRTLFVLDHCFNDLTDEIALELRRLPGDTVKVITMTYPSISHLFCYPFVLVYLDLNSAETYIRRTFDMIDVSRNAFLTVQQELAKERMLPAILPIYASDNSHTGFQFVGVSENDLFGKGEVPPTP
jgi:hypothetical protein